MKDPLLALQRHFEEQYGSIDIPKNKSKKRKRSHVQTEVEKEQGYESEEEWQGIQDTAVIVEPTIAPVVVEFTETSDVVEDEPEIISKKSFMVVSLLFFAYFSPLGRQKLPRQSKSLNLQPRKTSLRMKRH